MASLSTSSFAVAFIDSSNNLDVSLWTITASGVMTRSAGNSPHGASMVAVANLAGLPFTISDTDFLSSTTASFQADVWSGSVLGIYEVAATAVDSAIVCTYDYWFGTTPCMVSAASLPGIQAVTATADNSSNLHVDIWTFVK